MTAKVIDAHVHLIDPRRLDYPWLEPPLDRPHPPAAYLGARTDPPDAIVVEAGVAPGRAGDELDWIRKEAVEHPWIRGLVVHANVEARAAAREIEEHARNRFVVGVRRNLQDEPAGFTASAELKHGVRLLGEHGLPFDACVRAHQLTELAQLADAVPHTTIVLDHLGKPSLTAATYEAWRRAIRALAERPNVVCKLSGLTTEAAPGATREQLIDAVIEVLASFGPERCLFGSDWPVLSLAGTYQYWMTLVEDAIARFDPEAAPVVLNGTARRVYGLLGHTGP